MRPVAGDDADAITNAAHDERDVTAEDGDGAGDCGSRPSVPSPVDCHARRDAGTPGQVLHEIHEVSTPWPARARWVTGAEETHGDGDIVRANYTGTLKPQVMRLAVMMNVMDVRSVPMMMPMPILAGMAEPDEHKQDDDRQGERDQPLTPEAGARPKEPRH